MYKRQTSDDPSRYVPKEEFEFWEKRDPIERFERFLEKRGLWTSELRDKLTAEVTEECNDAAKVAEATPEPGLETIFSDVYQDVPDHIRRQGEQAFDIVKRRGGAAAGGGEFPL